MNYADTRMLQRVVVVAARSYPETHVGKTGVIVARYDGIDSDHGTVEVKLDNHEATAGGYTTHLDVSQLSPR